MKLALLLAVTAAMAFGAQISGRVMYSPERPLAGANVALTNEETGVRRVAWSNSDGFYSISGLPPGTYKLLARVEGFQTLARAGIRLALDELARIDLTMELGRVEQSIVVEARTPFLETEDAGLSMTLGRDLLENAPLEGRGLLSLLEAAPGVVVTPALIGIDPGQFSVNGQRSAANYIMVDGVSANAGIGAAPQQWLGGALPPLTALGSMHSVVSTEALDEFRMETSGARADSGRMTGGQLTFSTRSGGNQFHGAVFEFLRNNRLDANDWFLNASGQPRPCLQFHDFGGSLGGPVRRNRTFYFAAWESLRLHESTPNPVIVPSLAARQAAPAFMQTWMKHLPSGQAGTNDLDIFTEVAPKRSSVDTASVRLDHAISGRVQLFSRYQHAPSLLRQRQLAGLDRIDVRTAADSLTIGMDAEINRAAQNHFRAGYSQAEDESDRRNDGAAAAIDLSPFSPVPISQSETNYQIVTGATLPLTIQNSRNRARQWNITDSVDINRGRHLIQFGTDLRRMAPELWTRRYQVFTQYANLNAFLRNEAMASQVLEMTPVSLRLSQFSAFVQDTWKLSSRLTLSGGARWEFDPPPSASASGSFPLLTAATLTDSIAYRRSRDGAGLWSVGRGQLGPRAGAAWKPWTRRNLTVRAGMGLHHDLGLGPALVSSPIIVGGRLFAGTPGPGGWSWLQIGSLAAAGGDTPAFAIVSPFRTPYAFEWNVTVEQPVARAAIAAVSYVGSSGRRLLLPEQGAAGAAIVTNRGSSRYDALQATVRTRTRSGLQGSLSMTWAHSRDNASHPARLVFTSLALSPDTRTNWGNSDFDVRGSVLAIFTWQPRWLRGWSLSGIGRARSGFPLTVFGQLASVEGELRPDLVVGQPVWLSDSNAPGGKRLNPPAFREAGGPSHGALGRNAIGGPGMSQLDLALQKELRYSDRWMLRFRLEAFNVSNHANFGPPDSQMGSGTFGLSTSMLNYHLGSGGPDTGLAPALQMGGPRAVQLGLRLHF